MLILKKLVLGFILIVAAASVLLMSDTQSRKRRQLNIAGQVATSGTTNVASERVWKVTLLALSNVPAIEESQQGILDGLRSSKLVEGRNYTLQIRNAQGDAATLSTMVDVSLTEKSDLFIVISTLALQATLKKVKETPVVFAQVTDPIKAGAGKSFTDHLPNVTGSTPVSDHDKMIKVLKRIIPDAKRIGTLFNPSEDNSVIQKDGLIESAAKLGIEVVTVAANQSGEIPDAAISLCAANLDALCQISDNLTSSGFIAIANAANKGRIPLFAYQTAQVEQGASVAVARDFQEAGKVAGNLAARIIRGEKAGAIPFQAVTQTKLVLNQKAASQQGVYFDPSLLQEADKVFK